MMPSSLAVISRDVVEECLERVWPLRADAIAKWLLRGTIRTNHEQTIIVNRGGVCTPSELRVAERRSPLRHLTTVRNDRMYKNCIGRTLCSQSPIPNPQSGSHAF